MSNYFPIFDRLRSPVNTRWHGAEGTLGTNAKSKFLALVQQIYTKFSRAQELSGLGYSTKRYKTDYIEIVHTYNNGVEVMDVYISVSGILAAAWPFVPALRVKDSEISTISRSIDLFATPSSAAWTQALIAVYRVGLGEPPPGYPYPNPGARYAYVIGHTVAQKLAAGDTLTSDFFGGLGQTTSEPVNTVVETVISEFEREIIVSLAEYTWPVPEMQLQICRYTEGAKTPDEIIYEARAATQALSTSGMSVHQINERINTATREAFEAQNWEIVGGFQGDATRPAVAISPEIVEVFTNVFGWPIITTTRRTRMTGYGNSSTSFRLFAPPKAVPVIRPY